MYSATIMRQFRWWIIWKSFVTLNHRLHFVCFRCNRISFILFYFIRAIIPVSEASSWFVFRAMLPVYRQAPDYETAVRQKYYNPANPTREVISNPVLYSSHPDIHSATHLKYVSTFKYFIVACSSRQITWNFVFGFSYSKII